MRKRLATQLTCMALLIAGCAALPNAECQAPDTVRVFQAANIGEQWIDFVWVEIPAAPAEGTFPGRLFVLSADPVGAIVPSMIDLPCVLTSAGDRADLAPAPVDVEMHAAGDLKTSYGWRSCSTCSECYMVWTFSLDLQGQLSEGLLVAEMVLNETFHSEPMRIVGLKMQEVTNACTEPHLSCASGGDCEAIKFEARR